MRLETLLADVEARDWETISEGVHRQAPVELGWDGRRFALLAIDVADYCEPVVVQSGSEETRENVADENDVVGLSYESFNAGEAVDAGDAVLLATPNGLHPPHVRNAADYGGAVPCEKPL